MTRVIDRDRGARALTRRLEALGDVRVSVGIHEEEGAEAHPSGPSVAEVARFVEFGTDDTAPRSFVRAATDSERGRLEAGLARTAEQVARGRADAERSFGEIGEELAAAMRRRLPTDTGTTAGAVQTRVHLREDA